MKSSFLPALTCLIAACALGVSAFAQAPATPVPAATPAGKPKPLSSGDEAYVKNAVKGMNYLVAMAKLLPVSTEPAVMAQNRLRDTTVKDLTGALTEINKIVEAHALKIPAEMVGAEKSDLDRVTKGFAKPPVKGFENKPIVDWVTELMKESKRLDHETEIIGKTGQDADLKTFATNYGPSIRNVFTSAEALQKGLTAKKKP